MTSALSKLNELDPLSAKMTNEEHFIEIREQYNQSISEDSPNRWNYKVRRYETFCKILETIARPNVKIAQEMSNAFSKGRYSENDLFSDVIPAIQELRKNFKVGIISNGDTYPESLGLEKVIDFAIYAPDEKIEKPNEKIFLKAARSADCKTEQLLHVGDNEITDVSGAIDATEWVAPFHDMRLGLDRTAKYYYYPGWHEPGTVFELMINTSKWDLLPKDLQKIVEVAAGAISEWIYAQMEFHNQEALSKLREKQNVEILRYPDDVLIKLKILTKKTLDEEATKLMLEKNNPRFKRVYDAYEGFRVSYELWGDLSDKAYQESLKLE